MVPRKSRVRPSVETSLERLGTDALWGLLLHDERQFESWDEESAAFDLVFSAMAWHHLDPKVRYRKAERVLRHAGTLAVYEHWWGRFEECQEAYRRHVPEWADQPVASFESRSSDRVASLTRSGFFENIEVHRFPWTASYDADGYLALLGTFSDHVLLPDEQRLGLFDALHACIERRGGTVERRHDAVLFLASRR